MSRTLRTSTIAKTPSRPERPRSESPLGSYLGDVSKVDVLTPEQERTLSAEIVDRRNALWRALLSHPPFIDGLVEIIGPVLAEDEVETPHDELALVTKAARAFRDRETKANRDGFATAQAGLAERMGQLDLDGKVADRIAADLEAIDANRRDGLGLRVTHPPKGSVPFACYLQRVRNANQALRFSKNKFVKANLRLVVTIARRFDHGLMPLQDLVQEGNIGLMKAVDRFDGTRGYRFSTYATWWIRHAINRALANKGRTVRLPAHVSADLQRIRRTQREFEAKTGEKPDIAVLAKACGLSKVRVRKLSALTLESCVSLDAPGLDDERGLLDKLEDTSNAEPIELLERETLEDHLDDALLELQPIELDILKLRYGIEGDDSSPDFEPMTLRELGERHSLSRERIRQLQERALGKLRREFARRELS